MFHRFGKFCFILLILFAFGFTFVSTIYLTDKFYQDTLKDCNAVSNKYYVCSNNMEKVGNILCAKLNMTIAYYDPVGFQFGNDVDLNEIVCINGTKFMSYWER
jgi:hypothetical protein